MYEDHFGFTDRPFQLTPDARFWCDTKTHAKAMAYLGYGLAQGEGFIVVTGEVGAGKTTLVGHLLARIDQSRLLPIQIVSSAIEPADLLRIVAAGLGLDPNGLDKAGLLRTIEKGLHAVARSGRRTLLVVDEAQTLPIDALEELRMLSNFQAGGHALLQIFLLGQPEFRAALHGSDALEQLRQRVIAVHHLDPMGVEETADYIGHRLQVAGWQGNPDFAEDVFPLLHEASGGIPRRLNQLMGRVLLAAAMRDAHFIDTALVRSVVDDAAAELPAAPSPRAIAAVETAASALATDEDGAARLAALEARVEEQDAALRRVLTLLVDWIEAGHAAPQPVRSAA